MKTISASILLVTICLHVPGKLFAAPAEKPLWQLAFKGDVEAVKTRLANGADPNEMSPFGQPLLHAAAVSGSTQLVALLLQKGATIDFRDKYGVTAFSSAISYDKVEVAQLLLDSGADPQTKTEKAGLTPLHMAAISGATNSIRFLLDRKVPTNTRAGGEVPSQGITPIMYALLKNQDAAFKELAAHENLRVVEALEEQTFSDSDWLTRLDLKEIPTVGKAWMLLKNGSPDLHFVPLTSKAKTSGNARFGNFTGLLEVEDVLIYGTCESRDGKLVFAKGTFFLTPRRGAVIPDRVRPPAQPRPSDQ